MKTIRRQILEMLQGAPKALPQIADALGLSEKETLAHLPHVAKSASARNTAFLVLPARCIGCGFEFTDRRRISPPGRCPRCKTSRIDGPWYQVLGSS